MTWETIFLNGAFGGVTALSIGHYFDMPPSVTLLLIAIAGSLASVGFRWMGGFLKDWKQRFMAAVSGVLMSIVSVPYLASKGLEGLEAGVFVLAISLFGARAVKFLSTDFDVARFMTAISSLFTKK